MSDQLVEDERLRSCSGGPATEPIGTVGATHHTRMTRGVCGVNMQSNILPGSELEVSAHESPTPGSVFQCMIEYDRMRSTRPPSLRTSSKQAGFQRDPLCISVRRVQGKLLR